MSGPPYPNFLVLGTQKAGTSSLYHYLGQHPDVFVAPVKEPEHFVLAGGPVDFRGPDGAAARIGLKPYGEPAAYAALFAGVAGETAVGEASTSYLYDPGAAERIRRFRPDMRMIALLRDPVDRAWSAWSMARRQGLEPLDFAGAVAAEPERIAGGWGYLWRYADVGRYAEQIERYRARFPAESLRVWLFEDLAADPAAVVRDAFAFLGVDPGFAPDVSTRHNPGGLPRSRAAHAFLKGRGGAHKRVGKAALPLRARRALRTRLRTANLRREAPPPDVRKALVAELRPGIVALQDLLGRDLSAWLRA